MSEPLPCPFCGYPPEVYKDRVFCSEGSCPTQPSTNDRLTKEQAIECWNKRAPAR